MRVLICCVLLVAMAYGSPTCGQLKAVYQEEGGCCGNPAETPALKSPCSPGTKWDGATKQCVQVNKPWYDALIPDHEDSTSWEFKEQDQIDLFKEPPDQINLEEHQNMYHL